MLTQYKDSFTYPTLRACGHNMKALLRLVVSDILDVLIHLMDDVRFLMNANSSLLSLMIEHFLELMCSSVMKTTIVKGT